MKPPFKKQTLIHLLSASLLLLALFPAPVDASTLTLAWNSNGEPDLAGYKVYYGTQSGNYDFAADAGNVTQYTVTGLAPETRYYLALKAYDFSGNESDFSAEISEVTDAGGSPTPISLGGGGGGCFIVTAAYGSYLNSRVRILRDFRDEFVISNSLGRKFVQIYCQCSPRIANHIEKNEVSKFLARQTLLPLIGISSLSLKTTASPTLLLLPLCPLLVFTLALRSSLRHTRSIPSSQT